MAEIGCNWATVDEALEMIQQSKISGADFCKFQLFNKETIADSPFRDKLEKLILTEEGIKYFRAKADAVGIGFVLTPMYLEAVDLAAKYADLIKIRFKDHKNQPLIDKALATGKTVLISVPYRPIGQYMYHPRIKFLYNIPKYPSEPEDFNLDSASACDGVSLHFPHTLFDLAYAINRLPEEAYIEKHVMLPYPSEGALKDLQGNYAVGHYETTIVEGTETTKFVQEPINVAPIDSAVSISFSELQNFISELRLIERMKRTRI